MQHSPSGTPAHNHRGHKCIQGVNILTRAEPLGQAVPLAGASSGFPVIPSCSPHCFPLPGNQASLLGSLAVLCVGEVTCLRCGEGWHGGWAQFTAGEMGTRGAKWVAKVTLDGGRDCNDARFAKADGCPLSGDRGWCIGTWVEREACWHY